MRAVLQDGYAFEVGNFKAVRGGVVLFEDEDKEDVAGFVPYRHLLYVLSEPVAEELGHVPSRTRRPSGRTGTNGHEGPGEAPTRQALDFQRNAGRLYESGFELMESSMRTGADLTRSAVDSYLSAFVEPTSRGDGMLSTPPDSGD